MTLLHAVILVFAAIVIVDVIHYGALFLFLRAIRRKTWTTPSEPFAPKTAVILALRGADPFLDRCVEGLLLQEYPDYKVLFVVDHESDPACERVRNMMDRHGEHHSELQVADEHFETCSLKCSALIHAERSLDPSYEIVAVIDSDTVPHPTWLRELVEPFSDPKYGATTGQRWYIPEKDNFGSLVRCLWNAAAIVQMYLYGMVWGGSCALRRRLFTEGKLCETWKHALSDDMSVTACLRGIDAKTAFVPSLFIVNRETCTLSSFYRWVRRQLLCAKIHHPAWNAVVGQAVLITIPLAAAFFLLLFSLIVGDYAASAWSLASLMIYWGGVFGTLPFMERAIRQKLQERDEPVNSRSLTFAARLCKIFRTLIAVPLTQCVYTSALFWLHFTKRVEWRGIEYEIGMHKTIRLIEYVPYTAVKSEESDAPVSL